MITTVKDSPKSSFLRARCAEVLTAEMGTDQPRRWEYEPPERSRPHLSSRLRADYAQYVEWCQMEGREPRYASLEEYAEAV